MNKDGQPNYVEWLIAYQKENNEANWIEYQHYADWVGIPSADR